MNKDIGIVYFAYINPDKSWESLIHGQLTDVKKTGIFNDAALYVVVSNPFFVDDRKITEVFNSLKIGNYQIEFHEENKFEYYGIHKLWELGVKSQHKALVYFHTKGMSYRNKYHLGLFNSRSIREIVLTHYLFRDYKKIYQRILNHDFYRAGVLCNNEDPKFNFTWFNFFWISAEYIRKVVEPVETTDRYYYESWNGLLKTEEDDPKYRQCYSLYYEDFTPSTSGEASDILSRLRKIYKYTYPVSYLWLRLTRD